MFILYFWGLKPPNCLKWMESLVRSNQCSILCVYTQHTATNGNEGLFIKCVISMEEPGKPNREKRKCNRINIKGAKLLEQTMKIIFSFSIFGSFFFSRCARAFANIVWDLFFLLLFFFARVCDSTIFILRANKKNAVKLPFILLNRLSLCYK